MPKVTTLI